MILGMSLFTLVHVLISLIGIGTGLVLLFALMIGRNPANWAALFLVFTVLTSLTGFFFRRTHILPLHIIGAVSLVDLAFAGYALYGRGLAGSWRGIYVVAVTLALYLNVFVLVEKLPSLQAAASGTPPTGPVFSLTQLVVLAAFLIAGWIAWVRFRPMKF